MNVKEFIRVEFVLPEFGTEIGMNSMDDSRPNLDVPIAAVSSALGQTSPLMHRAKLENSDYKE